ncbi:MAG TPA: hypothetical protein VHG28_15665 [Longimicrobiaceae bacterium]|nr:hypothetical protein [Longimicrobiaceae bacterium]
MPDIRLVRPRGSHVWLWTGGLIVVSLLILAFSAFFGDPTEAARNRQVGAKANFGADRPPVIPVAATPFESLVTLSEGNVGLLVRLTGTAESRVVGNAVWVRAVGGRRILVRFEPPPETRVPLFPGSTVSLDGYIQRIARAELNVWLDSLGVALPRPRPGVKFGDLPDSGFMRIDSLFVKNYYVSVRPEGIVRGRQGGAGGPGGR